MPDCIFCKIAQKELPSDIVWEDESHVAFKDINPKAPLHLLVIPKEHIQPLERMEQGEFNKIADLFKAARIITDNEKLAGYKLVINIGKYREVDHIHLHILGGEKIQL